MKHTQGEMKAGGVKGNTIKIGKQVIAKIGPTLNYGANAGKPIEESKHNAERIEALWNAANDMTTEEAMKYITHGREMIKSLRTHCNACFRQNAGICDRVQHSNCRTNRLLTKLEAK